MRPEPKISCTEHNLIIIGVPALLAALCMLHTGLAQAQATVRITSPPPQQVARARRVLAALLKAQSAGQGAASLDGKMIDAASARMAAVIVKQAELIDKSHG